MFWVLVFIIYFKYKHNKDEITDVSANSLFVTCLLSENPLIDTWKYSWILYPLFSHGRWFCSVWAASGLERLNVEFMNGRFMLFISSQCQHCEMSLYTYDWVAWHFIPIWVARFFAFGYKNFSFFHIFSAIAVILIFI